MPYLIEQKRYNNYLLHCTHICFPRDLIMPENLWKIFVRSTTAQSLRWSSHDAKCARAWCCSEKTWQFECAAGLLTVWEPLYPQSKRAVLACHALSLYTMLSGSEVWPSTASRGGRTINNLIVQMVIVKPYHTAVFSAFSTSACGDITVQDQQQHLFVFCVEFAASVFFCFRHFWLWRIQTKCRVV